MANKTVTSKSFTLRTLRQRPNAGTYVDFVGFDAPGAKGKQNAVLQTNGPHDKESLVHDLFDAISRAWPDSDMAFEVNSSGVIVRVL